MLYKKMKRIFCILAASSVILTSYPVNAQNINEEEAIMADSETETDVNELPETETEADDTVLSETETEESIPSVIYQGYVQNIGWAEEVSNGDVAGSTGRGLRMEGLKISLDTELQGSISYRTHVQNIGWQNWVSDGEYAGTQNRSLRAEAVQIRLSGEIASLYDVYYRVHVQNIGWQNWQNSGSAAGTTGQELRVEAIQIRLTGSLAAVYDIYYRVQVEDYGWLDWASNGASAGTEGYCHRLEAMQVKLVLKGSAAPGNTQNAFRSFGKLSDPCPQSYEVSDEFGPRESPGGIGSTNHKGRDYEAHQGDNILAAADGVVVKAEYNRYRGYYVVISHWNGIKTVYQHMPRCEIAVGTMVQRGQVIGHVGTTGVSLSYHLHFEVWKNDVPIDPRTYL